MVRPVPGRSALPASAQATHGDRVRFIGVDIIDERGPALVLARVRLDLPERVRRARSGTDSG